MGLVFALSAVVKSIIALLVFSSRSPAAENALRQFVPKHVLQRQSRECLYNRTLALYVVEYAAAVYVDNPPLLLSWTCSRCRGLTAGFRITELVLDVPHCLQAYVGVAEDLRAIVITFRGTQETSYENWVEDLYFRQLDLQYHGIEDAMVHSGFYTAYHNTTLRDSVVTAVLAILATRNDLVLIVTGHSMGGAMASLCAVDLSTNFRITDLKVITFGQPRIGNSVFAAAYYALVPNTVRMTHSHDFVPHLPPYYTFLGEKTYHHFATEVWIFKIKLGRLQYEFEQLCDSSGEDPYCSRSVSGNSIFDHLQYLGVYLKTVDA